MSPLGMNITLCGAECTGKTSLAELLARNYGMTFVPEVARSMVETLKRPLKVNDVPNLIEAFIDTREKALFSAQSICFDTDLINTKVYSEFYFGYQPERIDHKILQYASDFYFLLAPDPIWQPDPLQRPNLDRRHLINHKIEATLKRHNLPYQLIGGPLEQRLESIHARVLALK